MVPGRSSCSRSTPPAKNADQFVAREGAVAMSGGRGVGVRRWRGEWRAVGTRPAGECWGGVLPGLGSGMVRGPYARWQLGQALDLPAISTSGPLALPDAGPEPGRCLKTLLPSATSHGASTVAPGSPRIPAAGAGRARGPGRAAASASRLWSADASRAAVPGAGCLWWVAGVGWRAEWVGGAAERGGDRSGRRPRAASARGPRKRAALIQ